MTTMTLPQRNGSHPVIPDRAPAPAWLRQSVQQVFSSMNWDDHPPEIHELKTAASETIAQGGQAEPLSLTMKVNQFFATFNWDGAAIALPTPPANSVEQTSPGDAFTLDDFSDLF